MSKLTSSLFKLKKIGSELKISIFLEINPIDIPNWGQKKSKIMSKKCQKKCQKNINFNQKYL